MRTWRLHCQHGGFAVLTVHLRCRPRHHRLGFHRQPTVRGLSTPGHDGRVRSPRVAVASPSCSAGLLRTVTAIAPRLREGASQPLLRSSALLRRPRGVRRSTVPPTTVLVTTSGRTANQTPVGVHTLRQSHGPTTRTKMTHRADESSRPLHAVRRGGRWRTWGSLQEAGRLPQPEGTGTGAGHSPPSTSPFSLLS